MWKRIKLYIKIAGAAIRCIAERLSHPGAAYWVFTPEHGNLGDHAIAMAEAELFAAHRIKVIEVSGRELQRRRELGGLIRLMNGRPILVHGGGFLGTLWFPCEQLLRDVIRLNPRSPILLLPNTVYYDDTPEGARELARSVEIYKAHANLTIYIREKISYQTAKESYRSVKLMPDMVMALNGLEGTENRSGGILCLRADQERTRTEEAEAEIVRQMNALFGARVIRRDMVLDEPIPVKEREHAVHRQFEAFRRAKLVVTDRLHGMIFCAITGTPCIVLDSQSPKLRGCYEWLRHLPYIRFCEEPAQIGDLYASMPKDAPRYDNSMLMPYYQTLADDIQSILGKR